jgi:putative ABC transport system substrate-binding protein
MKRREFIKMLGGSALWPPAALAQQSDRMRRIGVLMAYAEDNPDGKPRLAAFAQALQELGWADRRNIHIDYRWSAGDAERTRNYAAELVSLLPDVILAGNTSTVGPLQQATHTIPIVFAGVVDPVGAGFVESLARPGGHTTGFTQFEYGMSGKWLELLKEIAPGLTRVAVLRDPTMTAGVGQFAAIQAVALSSRVELHPIDVRDAPEIERGIPTFTRGSNDGLIVASSPSAARHRDLIIKLADAYRLPAVYSFRYYVTDGGLMSYGPDPIDPFQNANEG